MENQNDKYEIMYQEFVEYQRSVHEKNQKKIRVGLKVNILLPLVFLVISFLTNGSKLIFLILWIVSLFGIAFYLLYIEFTDFKMQEKMRDVGLLGEESEQEALIGAEVTERLEELKDIRANFNNLDVFNDIKELKAGIKEEIAEKKAQNIELLETPEELLIEVKEADDTDEEHS